jgi:molybdopterin synthase catalytic subunit
MDTSLHTLLTDRPLSSDAAHAFVAAPGAGASVVFTGSVRDHTEGRAVAGMEYEAHVEHAQAQLEALAIEVAQKWPTATAVWLEHRTGGLGVGEASVIVAVSAPHRQEAFEAARHAIDTLKGTVAIWKKEHWKDGEAHWPGTP